MSVIFTQDPSSFFISTRVFDLIIVVCDLSLPVEHKFSNLTIVEPSLVIGLRQDFQMIIFHFYSWDVGAFEGMEYFCCVLF